MIPLIGNIVINFLILEKEEKGKKYKSMASKERQELIIKKMKAKGIEICSGVQEKEYESEEIFELINIDNCFHELRGKR